MMNLIQVIPPRRHIVFSDGLSVQQRLNAGSAALKWSASRTTNTNEEVLANTADISLLPPLTPPSQLYPMTCHLTILTPNSSINSSTTRNRKSVLLHPWLRYPGTRRLGSHILKRSVYLIRISMSFMAQMLSPGINLFTQTQMTQLTRLTCQWKSPISFLHDYLRFPWILRFPDYLWFVMTIYDLQFAMIIDCCQWIVWRGWLRSCPFTCLYCVSWPILKWSQVHLQRWPTRRGKLTKCFRLRGKLTKDTSTPLFHSWSLRTLRIKYTHFRYTYETWLWFNIRMLLLMPKVPGGRMSWARWPMRCVGSMMMIWLVGCQYTTVHWNPGKEL